jgi:mono/diheme cytochrome c family protein
VGAALLASVAGLGWWQFARIGASSMDTTDPGVLALGDRVYQRECAGCHGTRLEGQPDWQTRLPNGRLPAPPHDPSGHTWHHPAEQLFGIVKDGVQAFAPAGYESDMPAYAGRLSDAEIWAVLAWIKSTWPADIRSHHDEIDRRSRRR